MHSIPITDSNEDFSPAAIKQPKSEFNALSPEALLSNDQEAGQGMDLEHK